MNHINITKGQIYITEAHKTVIGHISVRKYLIQYWFNNNTIVAIIKTRRTLYQNIQRASNDLVFLILLIIVFCEWKLNNSNLI